MQHLDFDTLNSMRLKDLQATYETVVGEPTRCPNKTFLIRKIGETLRAQEDQEEPVALAEEDVLDADDAEPTPEESAAEADSQPEEAAEETAGAHAQEPDADDSEDEAPPVSSPRATGRPRIAKPTNQRRGRFSSMTIEELQAKYLEAVGRPTGSEHRNYLIWKIREAEKGRIPVGPRRARPGGIPLEMKVLPLRLEATAIEQMDAAWKERGIKSRTEFFRQALAHYLAHVGAENAARMFAPSPAESA
ncbi:MAG: ribbon-helix-helix domain-containing protein [Polyangiaceae bacterium]